MKDLARWPTASGICSAAFSSASASPERVLERIGSGEADPGAPLGTLTDRELEVFDLISRGMNSIAIAPQLQVSVEGIQTYRSNIKAKLNSRAPPI
jgi:DNA-binding NarL/FixJ family response regulator